MFFFNNKNSKRKEFVTNIAKRISINHQISSLENSSRFEIKISTRTCSKEHFLKIAKEFLNENNYAVNIHEAGLEGNTNEMYVNFVFPTIDAVIKDYCYIDVIWKK